MKTGNVLLRWLIPLAIKVSFKNNPLTIVLLLVSKVIFTKLNAIVLINMHLNSINLLVTVVCVNKLTLL